MGREYTLYLSDFSEGQHVGWMRLTQDENGVKEVWIAPDVPLTRIPNDDEWVTPTEE